MKTLILLFSVLFTTMSFAQVPSYVPANGLVAWWPFNGNANDESGNGNNGIVNGATLTTDRNGVVDKAYSFDGSSWIDILLNGAASGNNKITLSAWVYRNSLPNSVEYIFCYGSTGNEGIAFGMGEYGSQGIFTTFMGSQFDAISNIPLSLNSWHNITSIHQQNGIIEIYLDGNLTFTTNVQTPNIQNILGRIGKSIYGNDFWNGKIDDIGIWNRALTQQEITNLYTSTAPVSCLPAYVPTSGLVGYWPFCGNANDESGNGNNGIVNGATLTEDRNGVANQAYSFDGNDLIQITNWDEVIGNSPFSINFWVKSQPYIGWIIAFGISQNGQGFSCGNYHWGSNQFGAQIWKYDYISGTQTNLPDNGWNLMSITYVSNTLKTYKNGSIVHTQNVNYVAPNISTGVLNFGQQLDFSEFFNGDLDDIGFWNRALTDCEIQNLYTSTNPSNTTTASACNSYTWNGQTYTQSDVYTGTTTDCVTQSLNLTIIPSSTNTTTAAACDSYIWNGTTYTQSGVYTGTTTNCVTESLNLTITPSSTNTTSASACDSYSWNGQTYSTSGVYTGTTTNCVTEYLNLTITPSSTNTTSASACDSYSWNGQTYSTSGVYTGTTTNCVTEYLNLTITPSSTNTTTAAACNSYTWNGQTYTQSGIYTGTTTDCVTQSLNLTITPSSANTTAVSACNNYTWNGTTYTQSGVYTGTTANCVTESLNLTITPSSTNTTTASACNSLTWNGQTYTQSGVYTGTTSNCVTQALNLTINTNTSSSISHTALDSYTWPVNNQTYTTTGAYTAVIPNAAGCDSTITLNLTMSFTGINELSASKLIVFPNPTNGDFTITGLELVGSVSSLTLTDMNGKVVKVLDTKATKFSMASIKPGVYFLNIISGNKEEVLKIVKE